MKLIRTENYTDMSLKAAEMIRKEIVSRGPGGQVVLGLATGNTPKGLYQQLVKWHNEEGLDFGGVKVVNLEEYIGIEEDHPAGFRKFMRKNLFEGTGISPARSLFPDGNAADPNAECGRFEEKIDDLGGIDLVVIGIGGDGHIGFHEPGTLFRRDTCVVKLSADAKKANAAGFGGEENVPEQAITLGFGRLMSARKAVILASGSGKAQIVRRLLNEQVTPDNPVSVLTLHPGCTLIADEDALALHQGV